MKKINLITLCFVALWGQAQAQKGLEIGIIAMPQVSAMYDTTWWNAGEELDYMITLKWAAGFQASINLTNNIGIGSGFLYSMQGQHFTTARDWQVQDSMGNTFSIEQRKYGFNSLYYKIPVFIKLNTNIQSKTCFVFMAGLQMGLFQKARRFDEGLKDANGNEIFAVVDEDYSYRFAETDVSAMLALDGRYNLSPKMHLSLLLRGDYSLRSIVKEDPGLPLRDIRNINIGIQLGLHYVIGR